VDPTGHFSKCEIGLFVGHFDEALDWVREQTRDNNDNPLPRPCGSAVGTESCFTADVTAGVPDVTAGVPDEYRILGYLDGLSGQHEVLKCKALYAQYKQALEKEKNDALRLCKEKCCDYIKVNVDCSPDAKDCFSGRRLLPRYVRQGNRWVEAGERENEHYYRSVSDPTACGSTTVVNCPGR